MLFCDSCDRGFHMDCCDPPVSKAPKGSVGLIYDLFLRFYNKAFRKTFLPPMIS